MACFWILRAPNLPKRFLEFKGFQIYPSMPPFSQYFKREILPATALFLFLNPGGCIRNHLELYHLPCHSTLRLSYDSQFLFIQFHRRGAAILPSWFWSGLSSNSRAADGLVCYCCEGQTPTNFSSIWSYQFFFIVHSWFLRKRKIKVWGQLKLK